MEDYGDGAEISPTKDRRRFFAVLYSYPAVMLVPVAEPLRAQYGVAGCERRLGLAAPAHSNALDSTRRQGGFATWWHSLGPPAVVADIFDSRSPEKPIVCALPLQYYLYTNHKPENPQPPPLTPS